MNSPILTFFPELEASPLPPAGPVSVPLASAKSSPTPAGCSSTAGPESPISETCESLPTLPGFAESPSLPEDFPASLGVQPGSEAAQAMTATSGRQCSALSKSLGPLGLLVKTCLASTTWGNSTRALMIWQTSVTSANRLKFRLVPSTLPTSGTASGLLPTATANQGRNCTSGRTNPNSKHHDGMTLNDFVRLWPTPRTNTGPSLDAKHLSLDGAVRLWPTPTKEGFDAGGHRGSSDTLYSAVGGSLNPEWVEWLMGYPIGHTALKDSATPLSPKLPRRSLSGSRKSKPKNSPPNTEPTRAADPTSQ